MDAKKQNKKWNEMTPKEKKKARFNLVCFGIIVVALVIICAIGGSSTSEKEVVFNNEMDASVKQVKDYLKENLNDPNSYDSVEWSTVVQHPETKEYIVRHKYRAKNAFGAVMSYNQLFTMDSLGVVIGVQDID